MDQGKGRAQRTIRELQSGCSVVMPRSAALRYERWNAVFAERRAQQFAVRRAPFVRLPSPKVFDRRMGPFGRGDTDGNDWNDWWGRHAFLSVPMQALVADEPQTLAEVPPRQHPAAFDMEPVLESMNHGQEG